MNGDHFSLEDDSIVRLESGSAVALENTKLLRAADGVDPLTTCISGRSQFGCETFFR